MGFDLAAAQKAGYSNDEIAEGLASSAGVDYRAARRAGYQSNDIIDGITKSWEPTAQEVNAAAQNVGIPAPDQQTGPVSDIQPLPGTGTPQTHVPVHGMRMLPSAKDAGQVADMVLGFPAFLGKMGVTGALDTASAIAATGESPSILADITGTPDAEQNIKIGPIQTKDPSLAGFAKDFTNELEYAGKNRTALSNTSAMVDEANQAPWNRFLAAPIQTITGMDTKGTIMGTVNEAIAHGVEKAASAATERTGNPEMAAAIKQGADIAMATVGDIIKAGATRAKSTFWSKPKAEEIGRKAAEEVLGKKPEPAAVEPNPETPPADTPTPQAVAPAAPAEVAKAPEYTPPVIPEAPKREPLPPAAPGVVGAPRRIWTAKGEPIDTQLEVVDAKELIASHDQFGNVNQTFPQELQPRDRSRQASRAQISGMSKNIKPKLLGDTGTASDGAPVVGPDGVVESGNARSLAIRESYQSGNGEAYKNWLKQNASAFGIDPETIVHVEHPVLIRRRTTAMDESQRAAFARDANQSNIAAMAPAEIAKADAGRITNQDMSHFMPDESGNVLAASNQTFIGQFMKRLGANEAAGMMTADGRPTKQLSDRIQQAVFAKAYGDDRLTSLMVEEANPEIRNIISGLTQAAPVFARARAVDPTLGNLNVVPHLVEAADLIRQAKAEGRSVRELLDQMTMFDQRSAETTALARFMDENNRSARRMGEAFKAMGQTIEDTLHSRKNEQLFGADNITLKDVIESTGQRLGRDYGAEQAQGDLLTEKANQTESATSERRLDTETRKKVSDMTPSEMSEALLRDHKTGLYNDRAYHEHERLPVQIAADMDSLKWVNDNMGHESGDTMIKAVADAMKQHAEHGYRLGGDEFVIQARDINHARAMMAAIEDKLSRAEITVRLPDGSTVTKKGVGLSYGYGKDIKTADVGLNSAKLQREKSGQRAGRGIEPAGVDRKPSQGQQNIVNQTAKSALEQSTESADKAASPSGLYSNPIGPMYDSIARGVQKLRDAMGVKEKSTRIATTGKELEPGLLNPFLSPSTVAQHYPVLAKFLKPGEHSVEVQERLRNAFGRRMHEVEMALGRRKFGPNAFNAKFKENKTGLWNLMLEEDMLGQRMSESELRGRGANDQIVQAHRLMRSAYDHALNVANTARAKRLKDPVYRREGYVPHFFHNYFIVADGKIVASARTLREAVSMSNDAARAGAKIRIVPKQFKFDGEQVQAAVLGDMDYFKMQGKLEKDFGMDPADAKDMLEQLVRRRGRSRFVGNFLERKGVEGWEKNLDWVHRHYFNMVSRYAAMDQFKSQTISMFEHEFGAFDKQHRGIAQYIKNYINDVNGVPTHVEDLINNSIAKVPGLGKFLGSYFGERPAIQLASAGTKAVAIAKLALYNISAAAVNGTQLINTNALIGPRWTSVGVKHWGGIEKSLGERKLGFDSKSNHDIGLLRQMGVDVAMGLASGAGYSKAGFGPLFRHSTVFFSGVERFNRAVSGLGAYHKAIAEGKTHHEAIDYGRDIIERTQFNYSVADTPSFIRQSGPVGQLLFQFKKFPIKQMEFMASLRGAEHAKFWIPFMLLGGYYALPGMSLLVNSVRNLYDLDLELELKKFLMEWAGTDKTKQAIATTITHGVLGNAGVDITHRVGAGDFIPSQMGDFAGPGISSVVRASQMAARGNWPEALRAITTAPGNLARVLANDGELTDPMNRERSIIKLTPGEKVAAGVGFMPERVAEESDTARLIRYETQKVDRARKEIIDAVIDAAKIADSGDEKKSDERAKRAMDRAEKMGISFTPQQLDNEIKQKNLTRAQRAWLSARPEIKARMAGVMEYHESRQPSKGD